MEQMLNSLGESSAVWRGCYADAKSWYVELAALAESSLDEPGLGEWSVRELIGHTSRALTTVSDHLGGSGPIERASAADYLRAIVEIDQRAVAERGRLAGSRLGANPGKEVAELAARTTEVLAAASDDSLVTTRLGVMALAEYLPTRTFELVVHGCDLAVALELPLSVPRSAAMSGIRLVGTLVDSSTAGGLLLALTGRGPLPEGFSVLG